MAVVRMQKPIGLLLSIIAISGLFFSPLSKAADPPGLKLEVEPVKRIYSDREGLMVKFIFKAQSKTKLCLDNDILSQMQISIYRPGSGKLALQPLVLRDNSVIFQQPMQVRWLESGDSLTLRANLKRFKFANGESWEPGEYNVNATFNLCEQTPAEYVTDSGQEIPIKAARQGWFMIML